MKIEQVGAIRNQLIGWYTENHRNLPWRETNDPYRIWVSEVMLQQTQVQTVLPYYRRFLSVFPHVKHLANADLQDVLQVWEGLGYYARARNLHRAAKIITREHRGLIPDVWEALRKLPGIGDYIAAAVLSIAFDQPHAVVDGNVKRVLARLLQIDTPVNRSTSEKIFRDTASILMDCHQPGIFNQAMMELGAIVCKLQKPKCCICPLQPMCLAYQSQKVDKYPKRLKPKPIPEFHIAVGVVFKNNRCLITRRKPEGLLGGLWEFPGGKVKEHELAENACIREIKEEVNLSVEISTYLTRVRHAYTHFRIIMDVFLCNYISGNVRLHGPVDFRWITLTDIGKYPFPKANRKFIPALQNIAKISS